MFVLKMIDENKQPLGMIRYIMYLIVGGQISSFPVPFSWFAVHCTSMNNTNELISADNKGYASYLMEQSINQALPGQVGGLLLWSLCQIGCFIVG